MYTALFRSLYLVFAGLFSILFVATLAIVAAAARQGDSISTTAGALIAGLCLLLITRALAYMRE